MSTQTFADFPTKTAPLTGDFVVGYDTAGEIKTTLSSIINSIVPRVLAQVPTIPVGTIITYSSSSAPDGWWPCDGRALSKTGFSNLYNVIGDLYGSTAGTFNLPDLRGYFVRGWDDGRGINLIDGTYTQSSRTVTITTNTVHGLSNGNIVSVTYSSGTGVNGSFAVSVVSPTTFTYQAVASQTTSGNVVLNGLSHIFGQTQNDGIGTHGHTITDPGHAHTITDPGHFHSTPSGASSGQSQSGSGWTNVHGGSSTGSKTTGISINSNTTSISVNSSGTASETRPKNIALLYCIKY